MVVALNKINCCCFENIILLDFFVVHLLLIIMFIKRRDTCFFCLLELFSDKFYLNFFLLKRETQTWNEEKKFEYKSTHVIQENIISFSSLTFFLTTCNRSIIMSSGFYLLLHFLRDFITVCYLEDLNTKWFSKKKHKEKTLFKNLVFRQNLKKNDLKQIF